MGLYHGDLYYTSKDRHGLYDYFVLLSPVYYEVIVSFLLVFPKHFSFWSGREDGLLITLYIPLIYDKTLKIFENVGDAVHVR